ncbi:hypothetical protein [Caudoviricetes sp.]|nr:hypothetical protein [Caudoviricetes sp.]
MHKQAHTKTNPLPIHYQSALPNYQCKITIDTYCPHVHNSAIKRRVSHV